MFWSVGADKEVGAIEAAHESIVWALSWHPAGHILCSGKLQIRLILLKAIETGVILLILSIKSTFMCLKKKVNDQTAAAHEYVVWALSWHPVGDILCSGKL